MELNSYRYFCGYKKNIKLWRYKSLSMMFGITGKPSSSNRWANYFSLSAQTRIKNFSFPRSQSIFEGALLVFHKWFPAATEECFQIGQVNLWVRITGLPIAFMKKEIVHQLLADVGQVVLVEDSLEVIHPTKYMQALVSINLKNPLILATYFSSHEDISIWVSFSYEKIFKFCKRSGQVGHKMEQCFLSPIQAQMLFMKRLEGDSNCSPQVMYSRLEA